MRKDFCAETSPFYQVADAPTILRALVDWGRSGRLRDFPWRNTKDRYRLLVSELMLRRTQAVQVVPVYLSFIERWPDLASFLEADEGAVKSVLEPLGLRWRAENLLQIRERLRVEPRIPDTYSELTALPGVGDYVASAVLCFSRLERRALVDTNTVRVIGRVFNRAVTPTTRRNRAFILLAQALAPLNLEECAFYHYALLDLAATVCRPARPVCKCCPLAALCQSRSVEG